MLPKILGLTLVLAVPAVGFAQDEAERAALALVDRAIKATGTGKVQAVAVQVEGGFVRGDVKRGITFSVLTGGPERFRIDMDMLGDSPIGAVLIGNGDKSSIKGTDPEAKFNTKLEPLREILFAAGLSHDLYAMQLTQFLPALKTKDFKLAIVGDDKVGERDAQVFRVSRTGRPDVNIALDKETALPIRCELRFRAGNDEFVHTILLTDHKTTDGVKHFTKLRVIRDTTPLFEAELSDLRFLEKADDKKFDVR